MSVFLQNAAGFFVQLFPCALMIFLPFPEEAYRLRRRTIFFWMTLVSVAMALLFSAAVSLRDMDRYPNHTVLSNPFMLAAIVMILAAYVLIVREALMKKLTVFFIVLFYAVTTYLLVNAFKTIRARLDPSVPLYVLYPYTQGFLLWYVCATAILLPLMLGVVIRPLREYIERIEPRDMKREFFVVAVSTPVCFGLMAYSGVVMGDGPLFPLFLTLMLFLLLNQMLIYWLVFKESVRRARDNERRRAMEIQQLQYEKIVGDMESTRRMRHDLRHHYSFLNDMLDRGETERIREYLSKLIDTTVNGLLQYYVGLARDEGIRCEVQAECAALSIEPEDLTVLFGNAMENAVNACRKYPGERWISVKIGVVQGSLAVEISNSCKEARLNRHFETNDGFLPAEAFHSGGQGVGYGLGSIAHTAQKYGGSAAFRFNAEKEAFTARIRLNLREGV